MEFAHESGVEALLHPSTSLPAKSVSRADSYKYYKFPWENKGFSTRGYNGTTH